MVLKPASLIHSTTKKILLQLFTSCIFKPASCKQCNEKDFITSLLYLQKCVRKCETFSPTYYVTKRPQNIPHHLVNVMWTDKHNTYTHTSIISVLLSRIGGSSIFVLSYCAYLARLNTRIHSTFTRFVNNGRA